MSSRLARWALKFQAYKFKIEHRRGKLNVVPDVLSMVHEDELAALDFQNGLFVDLGSEHFKSLKYLRLHLAKPSGSQRFFQKLYIDFLGPYPRSRSGNKGIFIVLDHFTKFVFLHAVKKMTSNVVVKYLKSHVFHTFDVSETIISENGDQFRSEALRKLLASYGVNHALTSVQAPQ